MPPRREEILYGRWVLRSLFKQDGYWHGRVRDLASGKMQRRSSHEMDKRKARQIIIDWIGQLNANADGCEQVNFCLAFEEWLSRKTLRATSKRDLDYALKVYKPTLGEANVETVQPRHIEALLSHLAEKKKRSPRTRQKHLTILRGFFKWARRQGYTTTDPTDGLRVTRVEHRPAIVLSTEQARTLIAAAREKYQVEVQERKRKRKYKQERDPEPHLWLALLVALHTALRLRNVLGLRWEQLDLEQKIITISGEEMKSHRLHTVPIHPELAATLMALRPENGKSDGGEFVLGGRLKEIKRSFKAAVMRAGLPRETRWHDLRRTVASWLAAREPWGVVQRLLGHRAPKPTGLYVDIEWVPLVRAVERCPALLDRQER